MGGIADRSHGGPRRGHLAFTQLVAARLRGFSALAPQLSRYTLVSAVALGLDFALFLGLTSLGAWPPLAGVLGYAAGTVLHYLFSVRFVFDACATDKAHARLFSEFALTGVSGMAATAIVIAGATDLAGLSALPAKVLAAGVSFLIVFALRRGVVFQARGVPSEGPGAHGHFFSRARALLNRLSRKLALPAPGPDFYTLFTVIGFAMFASAEFAYFLFSPAPSFYMPSVDGFGGTAIGRDFLNTWMGGRSALAEGPAVWFDFRVYNDLLRAMIGITESYFWSYPPHILLFIWPFGLLPYFAAFVLWTLLGFAAFIFAAQAGGVERKHLLFMAVAPAVAINVFIGQNGFFVAALLMGGLASLDRRPVLSGMLFGILTVKPQLGLLLPLVLAMTGRWRTIISAALTTAVLVGATAWLYGPDIWAQFLAKVVPQQRYLQEHGDGLLFLQISSAFYAGRLVGLPVGLAWILQAIVSAVTVAAVVWTFRRRRDPVLSTALLITALFLVTPYALNYDMVVLGWVLALLCQRDDNEPIDHYLIVAVWTLPATMMLAGWIYIPLAVLVLPAFAARLLWRLGQNEVGRSPGSMARAVGARAIAKPVS